MESTRLRQIGPDIPAALLDPSLAADQPTPPSQPRLEAAAAGMLLAGVRALSARTVVAVASLFTLVTAASAFWLWLVTLPDPSIHQLVGLALYGLLMLALNWLVLRRR